MSARPAAILRRSGSSDFVVLDRWLNQKLCWIVFLFDESRTCASFVVGMHNYNVCSFVA